MKKTKTSAAPAFGIEKQTCSHCKLHFSLDRTQCPHCARPQLFPNVRLAERDVEQKKLADRHDAARKDCQQRGCEETLKEFESACEKSLAVFNCQVSKLFREINTGTDLFETYHDLERLRNRLTRPSGHDWQKLRPQAEIELLGNDKHSNKLHYATLTIDGVGLRGYGPCRVTLREEMISHRASCFEGNSALIYNEKHGFSGYLRSSWADRAKLCAAKIAEKVTDSVSSDDFPSMLLTNGATQDDDEFIEVHVFGTMTEQTFVSVTVDSSELSHRETPLWKAIREKLAKNGVAANET